MPQKQHVIHGRDHEHGAADPVLIAWEDVGSGGSGGGAEPRILYAIFNSVPTTVEDVSSISATNVYYHDFTLVGGDPGFSAVDGYIQCDQAGIFHVMASVEWDPTAPSLPLIGLTLQPQQGPSATLTVLGTASHIMGDVYRGTTSGIQQTTTVDMPTGNPISVFLSHDGAPLAAGSYYDCRVHLMRLGAT